MVGVAVNVTLVPVQIVDPGLLEILTEAGNDELTDMVILLLFAVEAVTQVSEEVKVQVTTSPFVNPVEL